MGGLKRHARDRARAAEERRRAHLKQVEDALFEAIKRIDVLELDLAEALHLAQNLGVDRDRLESENLELERTVRELRSAVSDARRPPASGTTWSRERDHTGEA